MVTSGSTAAALSAIEQAGTVTFSAYVLRPGRLLDTLEGAARRGARVTVRLEGRPYGGQDARGAAQLSRENQAAVAAIRAAGGDAALVDVCDAGGPPLHLKAAVCDDAVFLDDRNWPEDGQDTIVRDDFPADVASVRAAIRGEQPAPARWFWTRKAQALGGETRLLYGAQHAKRVDVESESFGFGGAYAALKMLAGRGVHCRLLVARRDLTPQSQAALARLREDGVQVRIGDFDEKMAVVGETRAWTGSANATHGYPQQLDWGLRTDAPDVVRTLETHFGAHWSAATAL